MQSLNPKQKQRPRLNLRQLQKLRLRPPQQRQRRNQKPPLRNLQPKRLKRRLRVRWQMR